MPKTHSIEKDVEAFCGWDFLLKLLGLASPFYQGLMATMFGTGGRISEVLSLRKGNLDLTLHPDVIVVKQMPLYKRFIKVGEIPDPRKKSGIRWVTEQVKDQRTFPIRIDESLSPYIVKHYKKLKNPNQLLFQISRSNAFLKIRKFGEILNQKIPYSNIHSSQLYNHWFRAERACQLAFDYGFTRDDLREFFAWKERKPDMAERYASLGWIGLARRMGVKV